MFEKQVFWKDGFEGKAKGGLIFRSFDLNKFIRKIEEKQEKKIIKKGIGIIAS